MQTPEQIAEGQQEAKRLARESGWPDEMYFGLIELAERRTLISKEKRQ